MIKEAAETGGMIDCIVLDPKEAYGLLLELVSLGSKYTLNLTIHDANKEEVTRENYCGVILTNMTALKKSYNFGIKTNMKLSSKVLS